MLISKRAKFTNVNSAAVRRFEGTGTADANETARFTMLTLRFKIKTCTCLDFPGSVLGSLSGCVPGYDAQKVAQNSYYTTAGIFGTI